MKQPTYSVVCPACGALPGEFCEDAEGGILQLHPERLLRDEIEITLNLSKHAAYRLAKIIGVADINDDESIIIELEGVEVVLAQATVDVWCHQDVMKQ